MFKQVVFHGTLNERTGYGIHASRFTEQLSKLIPVNVNGEGDVHVSLLDIITAANTTTRHPYPSILYTVWEATEYTAEFMDKIKLYDQFWVPSEWQRASSIAQGIPEEFVKVVPEGVDPDLYHPVHIVDPPIPATFDFVHVGQWQPRKSTVEICQSFLKAFPKNNKVRLYLSADTLFPSDEYKSTEERLKAYGLEDPRIIPVHFEERDAYIRRLQQAHCFVTCARSEGWNLPLIEGMACGIPAITSDFGGSTEYAGDALNVRIRELRKPQGIYGNWDVPGKWAEPDYDHLVELMKDVYENYAVHKEKALKTSDMIRTKYSWAAAAKKAYDTLTVLSQVPRETTAPVGKSVDVEKSIHTYARKFGYDISAMHKRKVIFTVDCHPDSQDKLDTLIETINQVKGFGYPVLIVSHLPLQNQVIEMADYYIYDKNDVLSGDDKPIYWRKNADGTTETIKATIPCHALAYFHNFRNAIRFCRGKWDWIYHISSDTEVDIQEWMVRVRASDKSLIASHWQTDKESYSGQLFAGKVEILDKLFPVTETWEEFATLFGDDRFCCERGFYKIIVRDIGLENVEFLDMELGNRFDQVDRTVMVDRFECHFVDGPYLNINGQSGKVYDVSFNNPVDGESYQLQQKAGMWARPAKKFYRDWTIKATLEGEVKFEHRLDLTGKSVIVSMGSKALGDTMAWMPYVEEFRKKHNCTVFCSTWWNSIFDYPEIKFIMPGDVVNNIYATYSVGCFDEQPDFNPTNWRLIPLQKVSADILGLEYEPIRPKLKYEKRKPGNGNELKPYVCFSEYSTMQNKLWNRPGAWQKIIDYLNELGYDCVSISVEPSQLQGVVKHNGQSIEQTLTDISGAEFYIGLNAGPTWLAYSLNIPCIMITGVSEKWNDFPNPHRVSVDTCKKPCFNDVTTAISREWAWCPQKLDYACTRDITEKMVIKQINKIRKDKDHAVKTGEVRCGSERKHKRDDGQRPPTKTGSRSGNAKRGATQKETQVNA